jgi:hypothetical protein
MYRTWRPVMQIGFGASGESGADQGCNRVNIEFPVAGSFFAMLLSMLEEVALDNKDDPTGKDLVTKRAPIAV